MLGRKIAGSALILALILCMLASIITATILLQLVWQRRILHNYDQSYVGLQDDATSNALSP